MIGETSNNQPDPGFRQKLRQMLSLRRDQASAEDIGKAVRAGARAGGTNLWVLFFAALIASVGLNVNSTAVIIGAMLISPLMGPIVAIGYGVAVADLRLIRNAALNLAGFAAFSLVASTLYFVASPLTEPGSELMARTSPTLWDVLIAAFGGAAGMVALTRRSFNNIVPGVAIATALMPPLCTVGFGLAHGRWDMAAGALYLFLINGVFIAAATLAIARVLRLPAVGELTPEAKLRNRWFIGAGLVLVLAPSVWMGYRLVQDEVFLSTSRRVVAALQQRTGVVVMSSEHQPRSRLVKLTVLGEAEQRQLLAAAPEVQRSLGLPDMTLQVELAGRAQWEDLRSRGDARDQRVSALAAEVERLKAGIEKMPRPVSAATLQQELRTWMPTVTAVSLQDVPGQPLQVHVTAHPHLSAHDGTRLQEWLTTRLARPDVKWSHDGHRSKN
jgi:uncharacterized hydrophobic protein (TIGR00271 family)